MFGKKGSKKLKLCKLQVTTKQRASNTSKCILMYYGISAQAKSTTQNGEGGGDDKWGQKHPIQS